MNSNAMYCSSSEKCEEEMSLLERGILVMLGIPSFNAAASINFEKRFYDSKKGLGVSIHLYNSVYLESAHLVVYFYFFSFQLLSFFFDKNLYFCFLFSLSYRRRL